MTSPAVAAAAAAMTCAAPAPAAIGSDTNKLACRASKLDLVHSAGVCCVDLWDHGTGERAFVGRSGP